MSNTADPATSTVTDGERLVARLRQFTDWPTREEAERLGVELVTDDRTPQRGYSCANGDVVYPTLDGWHCANGARTGTTVHSGTTQRTHNAHISPEARISYRATIHPTARVEPGAVIAPNAVVGPHAHVGRGAHVGRHAYVAAGAYIGAGSIIRPGAHLAEGAVIGSGSDIGSCASVTAGTQVPQGTVVDAQQRINDLNPSPDTPTRRARNPYATNSVMQAIERLASLDRD